MDSNESTITNSIIYNQFSEKYIDKNDVTIVIPTLNEEKGIELVLRDVISNGYPNIIVIDGNSVDETVNIVKNYNVGVYYQVGKGKTGAIKSALWNIQTSYFVVMDGDYTYSAKDIEVLMRAAVNKNQVIGARCDRTNIKLLNRLGNNIINILFNIFYGTRLTDVCSGLYLLKTTFAKELILKTSGFDVEVEIAAQAARTNKLHEVPISYGTRVGIQKLNPFRDGYKILTSIFKLSKTYSPFIFYTSLIGMISLCLWIGIIAFDILVPDNLMAIPHINMATSLTLILGTQFLILAIIISQIKYIVKKTY